MKKSGLGSSPGDGTLRNVAAASKAAEAREAALHFYSTLTTLPDLLASKIQTAIWKHGR